MTLSITIVGEAWGDAEEFIGKPFVGPPGALLLSMLEDAGIIHLSPTDRANRREYWQRRQPEYLHEIWSAHPEIFLTNVFNLRPKPSNDVKNLCAGKAEAIKSYPALSSGKYVRAEYAGELDRLYRELSDRRDNVVIALGATAAWALARTIGIRSIRGAPIPTDELVSERLGRTVKLLPTYHPAAVLREWNLRAIVTADLIKAKREAEFPDLRRPRREIWVEPTFADLLEFERLYLQDATFISTDIETKGDQITCIGFAPARDVALVVPFYDPTKPDKNYWPTHRAEIQAWQWVKHICAMPKRFVFQNGMYDLHFLWRRYGIACPGASDDTMLLHHALQPEMQKGLGFLGSLYTDEPSWKFMRKKHETVKRED